MFSVFYQKKTTSIFLERMELKIGDEMWRAEVKVLFVVMEG